MSTSLRRDRRRRAAAHPSRRAWPRIRTVASTALLAVVSLFAFLTVVLPLLLGAQTFTVLTGSMQPGMPPGTMIAVRPASIDDVRVGDVVTYQIRSGDPAVVTHRVVGTTSSTGGARLLLTRGDANDADDPPVQSEQLRGTVVLAIPYLGYPAALLGGQERGAIVAAVGVMVVGYGVVLLGLDLIRTRRRRAPAAVAVAAVAAALVLLPALAPLPARADAGPAPSPTTVADGRLQLSADGIRFVSDGSLDLFEGAGRLTPGSTVDATLWIRNASPDPARVGVRLDVVAADAGHGDAEFARSVRLAVDDGLVARGTEWSSGALAPGDTLRIDVGVHMDAAADNGTRRAEAVVTPTIRLSQIATEERPAALDPPGPDGTLPRTGLSGTSPATLAVLAAVVAATGMALRSRRREAR